MSKLTVGYTYYTNKDMWEERKDFWLRYPNENLEFIIVDDGSPYNRLEAEDMPADNWYLYRVTEDIGFNNEGARNLIMNQTETDWALLLDLDHWPMDHCVRTLHEIPQMLENNPDFLWMMPRIFPETGKQKIHCNSFYANVDHWNSFGGYDETYSGYWGYDGTINQYRSDKHLNALHPSVVLYAKGTGGGDSHWGSSENKRASVNEMRSKQFTPTTERLRFNWERIT